MRLLPSCLSSASWDCWASWCVTCSSGRATTAPPTRRLGLALEVEAAVRPGLGSGWGGQRARRSPAQLGGFTRESLGLDGLTGRGLQRASQEGFLEVQHVGLRGDSSE